MLIKHKNEHQKIPTLIHKNSNDIKTLKTVITKKGIKYMVTITRK